MFAKFASAFLSAVFVYTSASAAECSGKSISGVTGMQSAKQLPDGTITGKAKANINIDGYGRAYHPANRRVGALIHLCNAGKVYLPDGESYHGSESNATCTGRFMRDFDKIRAAGWNNPEVGAINWYGILGRGSVGIAGRTIKNVTPLLNPDGSGFFISPTTLADRSIADEARQERYVDPFKVSAAVIPNIAQLSNDGVRIGTFGVAYDPLKKTAVPFIVGDYGPRVGEATPALIRTMAGLPHKDPVVYKERYQGQVGKPRIVWTFFGSGYGKAGYDHKNPEKANLAAKDAFQKWGGMERLAKCLE